MLCSLGTTPLGLDTSPPPFPRHHLQIIQHFQKSRCKILNTLGLLGPNRNFWRSVIWIKLLKEALPTSLITSTSQKAVSRKRSSTQQLSAIARTWGCALLSGSGLLVCILDTARSPDFLFAKCLATADSELMQTWTFVHKSWLVLQVPTYTDSQLHNSIHRQSPLQPPSWT